MSFIHAHCHTTYSLLDGMIRIDELCTRAADLGQSAVAITDHGVLFGAVQFVQAAKKAGVKPIIGMEAYVATGDDMTQPAKSSGDNYHLTLLAATNEGYRNLSRLTSLAHLHGLSYKPRIDLRTLGQHSEGLIVLSGCIGAEIPQRIVHGDEKGARALAERFQRDFNGRFFIEVMNHGLRPDGTSHVRIEEGGKVLMLEQDVNTALVDLANKLGVGLLATNDAHYLTRDDGDAHDTLLCLGMGQWKDKEPRFRFAGAEMEAWEYYIKSEREMRAVSEEQWWKSACTNTAILDIMVENDVVPLGQPIMPKFTIPRDPGYEVWKKTGVLL